MNSELEMNRLWIQEICEDFKEVDQVYQWEDSYGADGQCETASLDFITWALGRQLYHRDEISIAVFVTPRKMNNLFWDGRQETMSYKGHNPEVFLYQEAPHHWYRNGCRWEGHVVVKIGNICIDWTARQFHPSAPFPLIFMMGD